MNKISNNDIARAIYLSTKDKKGTHLTDTLFRVTKFLARRRLLARSAGILESLKKIISKEEGIVSAKVSSVKKLSSETKKDITHLLKKRYGAEEVILEEEIDENLLGGLRLELSDEVIDLSIKNKIGQLQDYLTKAA